MKLLFFLLIYGRIEQRGVPAEMKFGFVALAVVTVGLYVVISYSYGGDRQAMLEALKKLSSHLGRWAMPTFIFVHTAAIAVCFPYAVIFEAGASFLFGFVYGVICVFVAKVLGAALAFWLGRILFKNSLPKLVMGNKYFKVISDGVARDGWKFVLLARFSPVPSYIINYGLAATKINFARDFLLPTLAGGLPMILQNASIGSLTSAAANTGKTTKTSLLLPLLGIFSGLLITWRIKKYASEGFASTETDALAPNEAVEPRCMDSSNCPNPSNLRLRTHLQARS